jgi:hypothetical protein
MKITERPVMLNIERHGQPYVDSAIWQEIPPRPIAQFFNSQLSAIRVIVGFNRQCLKWERKEND